MAVTIFGGDLATGLIRVRNIPASAGSCAVTLGAAGTVSATVPLPMLIPNSGGVVVPIRGLLLPARSFLAWEEDGKILNAGPIWSDAYSFDTKRLQFSAAGIRSYWQYRYVLPALNDTDPDDLPTGKTTAYSGLSLRTIAKRLVQQAQTWTAGRVPVVFEPDFVGDNERTYPGSELHVIDEKLRQLSEVIGGPDIMFNPRYTDDARTHIEWVMQTGNPEISQDSPNPHKWDMTGVPRPSIRGASLTRDASVRTTDNYQVGATPESMDEGAEPEPLMAKAVRMPDAIWTRSRVNYLGNPLFSHALISSMTMPLGFGTTVTRQNTDVHAQAWALTVTTGSAFTNAGVAIMGNANSTNGESSWDLRNDEPKSASVWVKAAAATSLTLRVRLIGTANVTVEVPFSGTGTWQLVTLENIPAADGWTGEVWLEVTSPAAATVTYQVAEALVQDGPIVTGPAFSGDLGETPSHRYAWAATGTEHFKAPSFEETAEYPELRFETSQDRSSVINRPVLQNYADQAVLLGETFAVTWKFQAKKDQTPKINEISVGDFAVIATKDDPAVGTDEHDVRLLEISSNLGSAWATVACAPKREI